MTQSFSKHQARTFYHRMVLVRFVWAIAIGAFFAGMISLCLKLLGLDSMMVALGGLVAGLIVGAAVLIGSRAKREPEATDGCGAQCANCAAAGSAGCLSGFDLELEGRIAAYDAARLHQLGYRMRGVLILPVLLVLLGFLVLHRADGFVPMVFSLVALGTTVVGLALMRSKLVRSDA
ncbi:hypothetical protein [Ferrimicrobium sp.]|uniref:hypothetical protein n=1 Tax=Ferrimicrobium sp. TaxID=2926050 RepID=UPI00261C200A|nr:hypothetical protein [Ferrimicrobium sp.]